MATLSTHATRHVSLTQFDLFDPDVEQWDDYEDRLQQYFIANDITQDRKKVAILITVVGSKTYALLRNLLAPDKPATQDYEDIVETLKTHLCPKPVIISERFKFFKRSQHDGESINDYVATLRKLSKTCEFGNFLPEALRDRMVCGISHEGTQKRLLSEKNLTLERAVELALSYENAENESKHMNNDDQKIKFMEKQYKNNDEIVCFRCNGSHSAKQCKYKGTKCNYCGFVGHLARSCNKKKRDNSNSTGRGFQRRDHPNRGRSRRGSSHTKQIEANENGDYQQNQEYEFDLFQVENQDRKIKINVNIQNKAFTFELDTGAALSIISKNDFEKNFNHISSKLIEKCEINLKTYTGERIPVVGKINVPVIYKDQTKTLPLIIVEGGGS